MILAALSPVVPTLQLTSVQAIARFSEDRVSFKRLLPYFGVCRHGGMWLHKRSRPAGLCNNIYRTSAQGTCFGGQESM